MSNEYSFFYDQNSLPVPMALHHFALEHFRVELYEPYLLGLTCEAQTNQPIRISDDNNKQNYRLNAIISSVNNFDNFLTIKYLHLCNVETRIHAANF